MVGKIAAILLQSQFRSGFLDVLKSNQNAPENPNQSAIYLLICRNET